eukprot:403344653
MMKSYRNLIITFSLFILILTININQTNLHAIEYTPDQDTFNFRDLQSSSNNSNSILYIEKSPTLKFVITQALIDNFESSLTAQYISDFLNKFAGIIPVSIDFGIISLDLNITDMQLLSGHFFNNDTFKILDDQFSINVTNCSFNFKIGYEYLTEPPILADFGDFYMAMNDFNFFQFYNSSYTTEDGHILTVRNISQSVKDFNLKFDGISDLSDLAELFSNYGNQFMMRIMTAISSGKDFQTKFLNLINDLYGMFPEQIDVPDTSYFVKLEVTKGIKFKTNQFLDIPLFFEIQNNKTPFTQKNNASLPAYTSTKGDGLILYITEQIIDNAIIFLHANNMLDMAPNLDDKENQIKVSTLSLAMQRTLPGFDGNSLCTLNISMYPDSVPIFEVVKGSMSILATARTEFICQRNPNDKKYEHVLYLRNRVSVTINLYADQGHILKGTAKLAPITTLGYSQSLFGGLNTGVLNSLTKILEPTLNTLINSVLSQGFDINKIIESTLKTKLLQINNLRVDIYEEYIRMNMMPIFQPVSLLSNSLRRSLEDDHENYEVQKEQKIYKKLHLDLSHLVKERKPQSTNHNIKEDI